MNTLCHSSVCTWVEFHDKQYFRETLLQHVLDQHLCLEDTMLIALVARLEIFFKLFVIQFRCLYL